MKSRKISLGAPSAALLLTLITVPASAQSGSPDSDAGNNDFAFDQLFGDSSAEPTPSPSESAASPADQPAESEPGRAASGGTKPAAEPATTLPIAAAESAPDRSAAVGARVRMIEEVVVTANRREQNLQELGAALAVLDGESLERDGAGGFEDYVFSMPGVDFGTNGQEQKIAIRGIANVATNAGGFQSTASPVGLYLSDTPIQGSGVLPDMGLFDLERIEVLKGPQGTLYGEGSQGGTIKMLLSPADPGEFYAKGDLSLGQTRHASVWNRNLNLAANVPVTDSWALRLVGSQRFNAGFIDFPERGIADENDITNLSGRLHLDGDIGAFAISFMGLHQRQRLDQFSQVHLNAPDLTNLYPEDQFATADMTLAAVTVKYPFEFAELTSSSSWLHNERLAVATFPFTGVLAAAVSGESELTLRNQIGENPPYEEWLSSASDQQSLAQELRLVSDGGSAFDWILGLFYRGRTNDFNGVADNDQGATLTDQFGTESFWQISTFGEMTFYLPWDLQVTGGMRVLHEVAALDHNNRFESSNIALAGLDLIEQDPESFITGLGESGGTIVKRSAEITTTEFAPKLAMQWQATDAAMLYLSVANGVRSGGTNVASDQYPTYEPDSLWAYELGAKTQWLGGLLTANAAAYFNDWRNMQVSTSVREDIGGVVPFTVSTILNAGRGQAKGFEFELAALPLDGLSLSVSLSLIDAEIVKGDPGGVIADGTAMPQSPEFSYSAQASYDLPWTLFGYAPTIAIDTQSVDERYFHVDADGPPVRPPMEGFQLFGAQISFVGDHFDLTFTVKNLTDERQQLGGTVLDLENVAVGTPRTWTSRIAWRF